MLAQRHKGVSVKFFINVCNLGRHILKIHISAYDVYTTVVLTGTYTASSPYIMEFLAPLILKKKDAS